MNTHIKKASTLNSKENLIIIYKKKASLKPFGLKVEELNFIEQEIKNEKSLIHINQYNRQVIVYVLTDKSTMESCRIDGHKALKVFNDAKVAKLNIIDLEDNEDNKNKVLAFTEGVVLGNYQFLKYFKDAKKKANSLKSIEVYGKKITAKALELLEISCQATCIARDLVNEPVSFLTAEQLSKEVQKLGKEAGFKVEVFNKTKIKALKMGGLLAVNQGSIDPPTFSILEWKPKNALNKKPLIFIGKGVVYDTGGVNIKTSGMETMKCDMAGAAAVAGALYAISKANLPYHVIGLIPATDNRPDGNSYVPGDIITMFDGTTVEILNTDAEGRMILADALSYAKKYKPEFVIDLATLTGAAVRAIGNYGIVGMGNIEGKLKKELTDSGSNVHERIADFPFWDDYDKEIKSGVADIKNLGGPLGGAITAGKFLAHFTDYPWYHLDIAGPAFNEKSDSYRGLGGTGYGVRLLFEFVKTKTEK